MKRLYDNETKVPAPRYSGGLSSTRSSSEYDVPLPIPEKGAAVENLRVTDFKQYLLCPYRFYLSRILRIESVNDRAAEMNALQFGSLVHWVVDAFGRSEIKDSQKLKEIEEFLEERLETFARAHYGGKRLPAINVQIQQARQRLAAFAKWQAGRAAEGWRIEYVEAPAESNGTPFDVDGRILLLHGRIDRIDVHENGAVAILDYKTSKEANSPEKTHRNKNEWIDLQLPLYRHIAATIGIDMTKDLTLGYIALPEDSAKMDLLPASWSTAELDQADEDARDVVRQIWRGEFWPMKDLKTDIKDEFPEICMEGIFEKPASRNTQDGAPS